MSFSQIRLIDNDVRILQNCMTLVVSIWHVDSQLFLLSLPEFLGHFLPEEIKPPEESEEQEVHYCL